MQDIKPLIFDSSRRSAMHSVDAIIKNPSLLKAFIDLAFRDVHQFSMRAANVIEKYDAKVPCVTESYLDAILQHLKKMKKFRGCLSIIVFNGCLPRMKALQFDIIACIFFILFQIIYLN